MKLPVTNCRCRNCGHEQHLIEGDLMICKKCRGCMEKKSWSKEK